MSDRHSVTMRRSGEVTSADDEVWVSGELWRAIVAGEAHPAIRYDRVPMDLGTVAFGVDGLGLGVVRYRVRSVPGSVDVLAASGRVAPDTYAVLRRIRDPYLGEPS